MAAGWDAPSLTTDFGSSTWQTELEANMANIETAFNDLESWINALDWSQLADYGSVIVRRLNIQVAISGVIETGIQKLGFIVPFDCILDRAFARARVAPNADGAIYVDIEYGGQATDPNASILSAPIEILEGEHDYVKQGLPATDSAMRQGDFMQVNVQDSTGGLGVTEVAEDLQVMMILYPRDWPIYGG